MTELINRCLKKDAGTTTPKLPPTSRTKKTDFKAHAKVLSKRGKLMDEDDEENEPLLYDSDEVSGDGSDDKTSGALSAVVRAATGRDLTSKTRQKSSCYCGARCG